MKLPIGCHVSIAGGVFNAPKNAYELGCETFQVFTRSPQGGSVPELTEEVLEKFHGAMKQYKFDRFVIHTPYFINFGSSQPRIYHGSSSVVRQELERGSLLGASYVMFHPGSFKDLGAEEGMKQAHAGIIKALEGYEGKTQLLVEISAGAGEVIGDSFEELAALMEPLLKYKAFAGICFDTQHAFGSGYDLRTDEAVADVFGKFDKIIGLDFLKMSHVNDSKIELGGKKDRHEHIGEGLIGESGFESILKYFKKKKLDIPLILETEHDKVKEDIEVLKNIRNKV